MPKQAASRPSVNGNPLESAKATTNSSDNDVVEIIGIKMGFFMD